MSERTNSNFDGGSPELSLEDGWREFRFLMIKILEDVEERQGKQEITIDEIKKIVMNVQLEQTTIKEKHKVLSGAIGFIFGVIGYAIQYYFFTK